MAAFNPNNDIAINFDGISGYYYSGATDSSNWIGPTSSDDGKGTIYNEITRGYFSFDISSIPANATITSAEIKFYSSRKINNSYSIRQVTVERSDIESMPVAAATAYGYCNGTELGTVSVNAAAGYKAVSGTNVINYVNTHKGGYIAFGLRTTNESTGVALDTRCDMRNGANPPVLTVTWTTPSGGTNMQINIGDVWKDVTEVQINIGDAWKTVPTGSQINIGDTWKNIF